MSTLDLLTGESRACDALRATARVLSAAVRQLSDSAARLERAAANAPLTEGRPGWQGRAADAAEHALRRRAQGVGSVARAIEVAVHALRLAASAVAAAGWRAASAAMLGAATQPVLPVPGLLRAETELWEAAAQIRVATVTCAAVLSEAADRCRAVARAVEPPAARAEAVRRLGPDGAARWLAAVPAPSTAAEQVARWWAAHTGSEQRRLAVDPATAARVGALDGVPARVRDRANRAVLARRVSTWAARGDGSGAAASPASVAGHGIDLRLLAELSRVRLDPLTGRAVPLLLLTYEPSAWDGRGRAALAFGSPDTAAHVAYVVPGLGARVDPDLPEQAEGAWQVYATARRLASRPAVAAVAWMGYQTPDLAEVAFRQRAESGADLLGREIAGLRAARGDEQPHVTVIGHSYGSVVAALTSRRFPGSVEDLAVLGSPGLTVERADELPVESGHVWVGAASGDPVSHLSAFGVDPAAQSFGAHRFPAESDRGWTPQAQHSGYLDPGTPSLAALARIVAGQYGEVPSAPGRADTGYAGAATRLLLPPVLLPGAGRDFPPTFGDPAAGG